MTDLKAQLQAHLGDTFTLERELGGGGMSRVFVATENRLSRKVAIKVLSPELAQGLNAERFEREILLAASLQQANIVPMLSAGELDGLPYFTMPFVEGESLRNRITPQGMPIVEVVAILRDVSRALAYAHARGVVHRDIKPDNVLLSGGAAVVTDFGIAKALSASRTAGAGATLTSVGTSIGTPAYMAPEQVAGDPNVDHRVDLYALGCMAMELLTGQSPFANHTPQRMLAAHLSETPPSVESLRGDCPPSLSRLVAQLLQKDPTDRVQSAQEVLRAIDDLATTSTPTMSLNAPGMLPKALAMYAVATGAVAIVAKAAVVGIGLPEWTLPGAMIVMLLGLPSLLLTAYVKRVQRKAAIATPTLTPGGTMAQRPPSGTMATMALKASRHVSWKRTMRGGVYAMSGFVLILVAFMVTRSMGIGPAASLFASGSLNAQDQILLADFAAASEDSALAPIVVEAVRAAMSQSSAVKLLDQGDVANALTQMRQPTTAMLEGTVAREVAERLGASAILRGRLARAGSGYAISLELAPVAGGALLASIQGSAGDASDLISVVDGMTRKLRGKIGESLRDVARTVPLEQATTNNLEALRKYTDAVRANDIEQDFDRAVVSAREAVALDSTFALAWRKLSVALNNTRASALAQDSAIERAVQYADKLPEAERLLVMGGLYDGHSVRQNRAKALETYRQLYRLDSTNSVATNQLGRLFGFMQEPDSSVRYYRRQYTMQPVPSNRNRIVIPLLYAGRVDEAAALLDSIRVEDTLHAADLGVMNTSAILAYAKGDWGAARAMADTFASLPSIRAKLDGTNLAASLEMTAGRLSRSAALSIRASAFDRARGGATFDSVFVAGEEIDFLDHKALGAAMLDRMLRSAEWAGAPAVDRPYVNVARLYAVAGRPDRARQVLAEYRAAVPRAENVEITRAIVAAVEGEIALAEGNANAAVAKFRSTLREADGSPPSCALCAPIGLARAFDQAGQADSAIAWYERYLTAPAAQRLGFFQDARYLAAYRKRLGELYDAKGDRANAMKYYSAFVDQWKDADPELQPVVATVKKRLNELRAVGQ